MGDGGRVQKPGQVHAELPQQDRGKLGGSSSASQNSSHLPSSIDADRKFAQDRISTFQRGEARARVMRKSTASAGNAQEPGGIPAKAASGDWRAKLTGGPSQQSGSSLPGDVRARMEPQLGADLSGVKVHTDGEAAKTAGQLGARAFTVGANVHFNSGEYAPGTREGDRLIGHELTHVVQGQRSGIHRKAEKGSDAEGAHAPEVSQPGEPAEQEADAVGDKVAEKLHGGAKENGDDSAALLRDGAVAPPQSGVAARRRALGKKSRLSLPRVAWSAGHVVS